LYSTRTFSGKVAATVDTGTSAFAPRGFGVIQRVKDKDAKDPKNPGEGNHDLYPRILQIMTQHLLNHSPASLDMDTMRSIGGVSTTARRDLATNLMTASTGAAEREAVAAPLREVADEPGRFHVDNPAEGMKVAAHLSGRHQDLTGKIKQNGAIPLRVGDQNFRTASGAGYKIEAGGNQKGREGKGISEASGEYKFLLPSILHTANEPAKDASTPRAPEKKPEETKDTSHDDINNNNKNGSSSKPANAQKVTPVPPDDRDYDHYPLGAENQQNRYLAHAIGRNYSGVSRLGNRLEAAQKLATITNIAEVARHPSSSMLQQVNLSEASEAPIPGLPPVTRDTIYHQGKNSVFPGAETDGGAERLKQPDYSTPEWKRQHNTMLRYLYRRGKSNVKSKSIQDAGGAIKHLKKLALGNVKPVPMAEEEKKKLDEQRQKQIADHKEKQVQHANKHETHLEHAKKEMEEIGTATDAPKHSSSTIYPLLDRVEKLKEQTTEFQQNPYLTEEQKAAHAAVMAQLKKKTTALNEQARMHGVDIRASKRKQTEQAAPKEPEEGEEKGPKRKKVDAPKKVVVVNKKKDPRNKKGKKKR
jgi:hypothetical protein